MTSASGRGTTAFQVSVTALAQYREREGGGMPGRGHVELLPDSGEHRTGVWIANQKQRRDRPSSPPSQSSASTGRSSESHPAGKCAGKGPQAQPETPHVHLRRDLRAAPLPAAALQNGGLRTVSHPKGAKGNAVQAVGALSGPSPGS